MQPSSKYASTATTSKGFTYNETDNNITTLFSLNSVVDNSIAYSKTTDSEYKKYSMACWASNANSWYVNQSIHADIPWRYSSSSTRHAYVKSVSVSKDWASNKSCSVYNIFLNANSQSREYNFGYNVSESSTAGSFTAKVVSDFDVNNIVFTASVSGLTKTEWENFISSGTITANHTISLSDFLEAPENYMISDFQVKSLATWDSVNDTWKANEIIYPTALIDSEEMRSIVGYKVLFYKNLHMGCTSDYAGANLYCDNMTVYTNAWEYGTMTSQIDQINGNILGSALDSLVVYPALSGDEIITACEDGVTGTFSTPWIKFNTGNSFIDMYESDTYTLVQDTYPADASTSHPNSWKKHFRQMIFGTKVSECMAQIGVYFWTDTVSDLNSSSCTPDDMSLSESMYLGAMNSDGLTSGTWIRGEDIDDYNGINKAGSIVHPDFDPSGGGGGAEGDGEDDIDSMGFDGMSCSVGGPAKYYIMSYSDIHHLIGDFNAHAEPGTSISNNIISCYVNALDWNWSTGSEAIQIFSGGAQTNAFTSDINYKVLSGYNKRDIIGSIDVPRMTNTFYDFSPYSTYEVYVPFCGWVALPDTVAGRNIKIYFETDEATCGCKGRVFFVDSSGNGVTVAEITGSFGAPCPIQVIEGGLYKQAMLSNGLQVIGGIASGVMGGAMGAGALAVSGFSSAMQSLGNCLIAGNTNYGQTIGRAGDASGLMCAGKPYLKITYPPIDEVVNNSMFGHTIGYLCNEVGVLRNYHGFTVCLNPHITGIDCTDEEKEEIKRLLEDGVIL